MRTDENNNPTAMTTNVAKQGGLIEGVDYVEGTPFAGGKYHTAKLLAGDPIIPTIKVIDEIGFRNQTGEPRWVYINFPHFIWLAMTEEMKVDIIGWMYGNEGGTLMRHYFPNYGKQ